MTSTEKLQTLRDVRRGVFSAAGLLHFVNNEKYKEHIKMLDEITEMLDDELDVLEKE